MMGFAATPLDTAGAVTTSLFLPLSGDVINPGAQPSDPCHELVHLGGMVHVVSIFAPNPPPISQGPSPPPIKLLFNMAGVMGTGDTTTNTYVATGAQDVSYPSPPPIAPQALTPPSPIFQLEGTGSCAEQVPLPVNFNLLFDATGHLLPGSTAGFGQCSSDFACGG